MNTFTLVGRKFESGIVATSKPGFGPAVMLTTGKRQYVVPVSGWQKPGVWKDDKLFSAEEKAADTGRKCLSPQETWDGACIRIRSWEINLGFTALADGLYVRTGVDNEPFAQAGLYSEPRRDQLFLLNRGARLLIIDQFRSVGWISYSGATPTIRGATPEELAEYVTAKALERNTNAAYKWGIHFLEKLGKREHHSKLVVAQRTLRVC